MILYIRFHAVRVTRLHGHAALKPSRKAPYHSILVLNLKEPPRKIPYHANAVRTPRGYLTKLRIVSAWYGTQKVRLGAFRTVSRTYAVEQNPENQPSPPRSNAVVRYGTNQGFILKLRTTPTWYATKRSHPTGLRTTSAWYATTKGHLTKLRTVPRKCVVRQTWENQTLIDATSSVVRHGTIPNPFSKFHTTPQGDTTPESRLEKLRTTFAWYASFQVPHRSVLYHTTR